MRIRKRLRLHHFPHSEFTAILLIVCLLLGACTTFTQTPSATPSPRPVDSPAPTSIPTETPTVLPPSPSPTDVPPTHTHTPSPSPTSKPKVTPSPQPTLRYGKILFPLATLDSDALIFATFKEPSVDIAPTLQDEPIAPDLSNVNNAFLLSPAQLERLAQNGFVVSPGSDKEFFVFYEKARYAQVPVFVTSDSLLHIYHLLFDKVLRTAEVEHLIPLLRTLNRGLLARAESQYQELQGSNWEAASQRTVAFVAVASALLEPDIEIPGYVADLVEAELALIQAADGMYPSPLFPKLPVGEDYTQYIPRGHYTLSEELSAYFKSMMWYGRMTFRLKTEDPAIGRAETRAALLLVHALRTTEIANQPALEMWAELYNPTVFFVGRSDDLTVVQYGDVMDTIYGPDATLADLTNDAKLDPFIEAADALPPPRILGMVIMADDDEQAVTKGLRFMGQRFVPDAYMFSQLLYTKISTPENKRLLPNGLDVPAVMGSARAYEILDAIGETNYARYDEQLAKLQSWASNLSTEEWTETLYNTWLYNFYPLLEAPGQAYPQFMRSSAWVDKQLNTVLGSWAELKHDTILYAKQAYSELGGAPEPPAPALPPRGYVEPVPQFYARLGALIAMTQEGLGKQGMLGQADEGQLQHLAYLVASFQAMAEKELRGEALTEQEYHTIRFYGGDLERLTAAASVPLDSEWPGDMMEEEPQAAVIADVATSPSLKQVLEVGVGRINELYAVVPLIEADGSITLQVAKGGVFAYHEFAWPMDDRLTDETWRDMLEAGNAPPPPAWTESFFVPESGYDALRQAIYRVHESLVDAFWLLNADTLRGGETLQAQLAPAIAALRAENRCQRRLLLSTSPRSIDRQSETLVVVTTRETWEDALYEYGSGWCESYEEMPLARRGPYTLDVTYTLEKREGDWHVTRVVYANEPPGWK